MFYRVMADAVVGLHLSFVLFVVFGGFLAWRWPRLAWLHVPTFLWVAGIEILGWICPLTYLENNLRAPGGGLCRQLRRTLHFAFAVSGTAFPGRVLPVLVYLDRHFCAGSQRLDLLPALGQTSPPAGQFLTGGIFPPWPPKPAHRYTVHDSRAVGPATGTGVIGCRTMGPSSVLLS